MVLSELGRYTHMGDIGLVPESEDTGTCLGVCQTGARELVIK